MGKWTTRTVLGVGILWEAVSLMLPGWFGIPLALVGLAIIAWSLYPIPANRLVRRFPRPMSWLIFGMIRRLEFLVDGSKTEFITGNSQRAEDNKTFIEYAPEQFRTMESSNISSVTDNGPGDFIFTFINPLNAKTLAVHSIGEAARDFRVESATKDHVRVIYSKEPNVIALRFDD